MKKIRTTSIFITMFVFLFAGLLTGMSTVQAQTTELFISEYIEGSSYNKALEIYNGTGAAIDLSTYIIRLYSNGASSATASTTLSGTLADGDVYIIAHPSADTAILAVADTTNGSVVNFNGNDTVTLENGGTVVDVIGQIGSDPGTEWGSGDTSTQDNTIRRKTDICGGDIDPSDAFDPSIEWDGFAQNTFDGLGTHIANCGSGPSYTPIYDIQYTTDPSGDSPYKDQSDITTEGIVTAVFPPGYFIEDPASGAWNGLYVYDTNTPAMGDRVRLTGTVAEYNNITELKDLTSYEIVSSGNPSPTPEILQTGDVSQEQWEGVLVRVENVTVTDDNLGYGEWSVNDGSGDVVIDDKGSYLYTPVNGDALAAVIGPLDYTFGAFKIQPRDDNDIILPAPPPSLVINEILADPASGLTGDANGDGIRDGSEDEFVEIVNNSDSDVDISGWNLADAVSVRHIFPGGTVISAHCTIVVFGGGAPTGAFGNAVVQTASTGMLGLNNGGDTVTLNDGSTDQATVSYGSEGGNDQSLTLDPDIIGSGFVPHSTATGSGGDLFSPGTMIDGSSFPGCSGGAEFGACGDPATFIHDIQGSGLVSPLIGASGVIIEGVVVGDFQDPDTGINGFFIQEEDSQTDGDPMTSEGIFVYDNSLDVNVGDVVRVQGDVDEFYGLTQLDNISNIAMCSQSGSASAEVVNLPFASADYPERYEGMLVTFPQELTISDNYDLVRYGEMILSNGRLYTPTNITTPGAAALAQQAANDLNQILLDDGRNGTYRTPFPFGFNALNPVRTGYTITNLTGVMHYGYGEYRVQPTTTPILDPLANPRTTAPASVDGTLKVASVNLLNYFTTLDEDIPVCGPAADQDCRGANSVSEFTRQRDKTIDAITTIDADIAGLMELENNSIAAIQDLVNGLNVVAGAGTYDFINTGTIGTDAIRVALIYKPATVMPVGSFAIIDSSVDPRFNDDRNRPSLAQTFQEIATGEKLTVVVNHLKSKGSPCEDIGDPDTGDGQGNCNLTRTSAAAALVDWLATDPTGSGDPDFLIIGDLNSYAMEDPITAIKDAGYTNLIHLFGGEEAYSYVYFAQAGYLDHALANDSLTLQVTGATDWHINADEHPNIDYNEETLSSSVPKPADFYNADQYRASDHDPVIVGLNLRSIKDIVGTDRLPETPIFDVFAGDIFTYTIEFENPFDQELFFTVSDTLDMYLEYISGPFLEMPDGTLQYTTDDLLDAEDIFSLSFEVRVQDAAPIGWIFENIAWITAHTDQFDIAGTTVAVFKAISPQGKVIPEPATLLLLGTGLVGGGTAALIRRKRGRKKGN